jgi:hypothetical protein
MLEQGTINFILTSLYLLTSDSTGNLTLVLEYPHNPEVNSRSGPDRGLVTVDGRTVWDVWDVVEMVGPDRQLRPDSPA